jgi:hypothetical protein
MTGYVGTTALGCPVERSIDRVLEHKKSASRAKTIGILVSEFHFA